MKSSSSSSGNWSMPRWTPATSPSRGRLSAGGLTSPRALVARAPLLLEFTATTLRCGIVGQDDARPKDVLALPPPPSPRDSADLWYRYLSPVVQQALQRLGVNAAKDRRALVLWNEMVRPRSVEQALYAVLVHTLKLPAVALLDNTLQPYALPQLQELLLVDVQPHEVSCWVHANDQTLAFTYQSVPLATQQQDSTTTYPSATNLQDAFLRLDHPSSVLLALLKCLEACPRTIRTSVVHNIVVSGTGLCNPTQQQLAVKMVQQLPIVLRQAPRPRETLAADDQDPATEETDTTDSVLTSVPVVWKELAGLADHVGLVAPSITPVLLSWTGAAQWATHWYGADPNLSHIAWCNQWPPVADDPVPPQPQQ